MEKSVPDSEYSCDVMITVGTGAPEIPESMEFPLDLTLVTDLETLLQLQKICCFIMGKRTN